MKGILLKREIYNEHLKVLKNLNIPHKKLIIFFAGVPGAGKTYISKVLEKRYNGIRVNNDELRRLIRILYKRKFNSYLKNVDKILYDYLDWFISNYKFSNRLIIADRGIDRKYEELLLLVKKLKYPFFIISIKLTSRRLLEKRVKKKLRGKLDRNFIENIDRWIRENREFNKNFKSDIIIKNEKNDEFDLSSLFRKLDKLIE